MGYLVRTMKKGTRKKIQETLLGLSHLYLFCFSYMTLGSLLLPPKHKKNAPSSLPPPPRVPTRDQPRTKTPLFFLSLFCLKKKPPSLPLACPSGL